MRRAPPVNRRGRRSLALVGFVLLLVVASSPGGSSPSAKAATPFSAAIVPSTVPGTRWVVLNATNGSATAGDLVQMFVHISPFNCSGADTPIRTVAEIAVHLGDGYTFEEFEWPTSNSSACARAPWTTIVPVAYAYRYPGTYPVSATVTWRDGEERNSSAITLTIQPRTDLTSWLTDWLVGAWLVMAVCLALLFVLRPRLPESPSLPPREA